jgi:hypothetical protein
MCCRWCSRTGTADRWDPSRRPDRSRRSWLPLCTWRHCPRWARDSPPGSLCLVEGLRRPLWCRRYSWCLRHVWSRPCHPSHLFHPPHPSRRRHPRLRFLPCLMFHQCLASRWPCTGPRCQTVRSDRSHNMPTHRPCLCIGLRQGSGRSHPRSKSTGRRPAWLHIGPWRCIARCTSLWRSPSRRLLPRRRFDSQQQVRKYQTSTRTLPCRPVAGSAPFRNYLKSFHLRRLRPSRREFHLSQIPSNHPSRFHRCPMTCLRCPACHRDFHLSQVPTDRRKRSRRCPISCLQCPACHRGFHWSQVPSNRRKRFRRPCLHHPSCRRELLHRRWDSHQCDRSCCWSSSRPTRTVPLSARCGRSNLCFA